MGNFRCPPGSSILGPRPAGSDDRKFKDLLHPKFKRKTHIFYQNKEELDHTEEKQYAPQPPNPRQPCRARAARPWRASPGGRWREPRNIPHST